MTQTQILNRAFSFLNPKQIIEAKKMLKEIGGESKKRTINFLYFAETAEEVLETIKDDLEIANVYRGPEFKKIFEETLEEFPEFKILFSK